MARLNTTLLCRIGWHAPLPRGRWNGGYCFTTCRRCGRDMVRSAFGEWHVPRGIRVVWAARAPGDLGAALDAREAAGRAADPPAAPVAVESERRPPPDPPPPPPTTTPLPPVPDRKVPDARRPITRPAPDGRSPFDFGDFG